MSTVKLTKDFSRLNSTENYNGKIISEKVAKNKLNGQTQVKEDFSLTNTVTPSKKVKETEYDPKEAAKVAFKNREKRREGEDKRLLEGENILRDERFRLFGRVSSRESVWKDPNRSPFVEEK